MLCSYCENKAVKFIEFNTDKQRFFFCSMHHPYKKYMTREKESYNANDLNRLPVPKEDYERPYKLYYLVPVIDEWGRIMIDPVTLL